MKQWVRLAAYFYPASWRRRYAVEFDAMLDQVDAEWKDVFNTLRGALTMQFTSWNFKTIVLTFGLIGVVIAAAIAFRIPTEYRSMSVLRLSGDADLSHATTEVLSRTSLEKTITGLDLYQARRKDTPMENIVEYMRMHDVAIRMLRSPAGEKNPVAFSISFTYPNRKLAQAVNRELVTKFTEVLPRTGSLTSLEVLDPPSEPAQPFSPNRYPVVFLGLFLGILTGLIVSYALRWRIMIVRRPAY